MQPINQWEFLTLADKQHLLSKSRYIGDRYIGKKLNREGCGQSW
jgi:hypothetical protein